MDEIRVSGLAIDSDGNLVVSTCEVVDPGRADIERRYRIPRTFADSPIQVEEWRVYNSDDRRLEREVQVNADRIPSGAVIEAYEWVMSQLECLPRPRAEVIAILAAHADTLAELKRRKRGGTS